jgi:hypothetical protein
MTKRIDLKSGEFAQTKLSDSWDVEIRKLLIEILIVSASGSMYAQTKDFFRPGESGTSVDVQAAILNGPMLMLGKRMGWQR